MTKSKELEDVKTSKIEEHELLPYLDIQDLDKTVELTHKDEFVLLLQGDDLKLCDVKKLGGGTDSSEQLKKLENLINQLENKIESSEKLVNQIKGKVDSFDGKFVKKDGSEPLTNDWNIGEHHIKVPEAKSDNDLVPAKQVNEFIKNAHQEGYTMQPLTGDLSRSITMKELKNMRSKIEEVELPDTTFVYQACSAHNNCVKNVWPALPPSESSFELYNNRYGVEQIMNYTSDTLSLKAIKKENDYFFFLNGMFYKIIDKNYIATYDVPNEVFATIKAGKYDNDGHFCENTAIIFRLNPTTDGGKASSAKSLVGIMFFRGKSNEHFVLYTMNDHILLLRGGKSFPLTYAIYHDAGAGYGKLYCKPDPKLSPKIHNASELNHLEDDVAEWNIAYLYPINLGYSSEHKLFVTSYFDSTLIPKDEVTYQKIFATQDYDLGKILNCANIHGVQTIYDDRESVFDAITHLLLGVKIDPMLDWYKLNPAIVVNSTNFKKTLELAYSRFLITAKNGAYSILTINIPHENQHDPFIESTYLLQDNTSVNRNQERQNAVISFYSRGNIMYMHIDYKLFGLYNHSNFAYSMDSRIDPNCDYALIGNAKVREA